MPKFSFEFRWLEKLPHKTSNKNQPYKSQLNNTEKSEIRITMIADERKLLHFNNVERNDNRPKRMKLYEQCESMNRLYRIEKVREKDFILFIFSSFYPVINVERN